MTYQKIHVLTELRKLANGKPTKAPAAVMAGCAIQLVQAGMRDREAEELGAAFYTAGHSECLRSWLTPCLRLPR